MRMLLQMKFVSKETQKRRYNVASDIICYEKERVNVISGRKQSKRG